MKSEAPYRLFSTLLIAAALGLSACGGNGALGSKDGKNSARYGLTPGLSPEQFVVGSSYLWKFTFTQQGNKTVSYQKISVLRGNRDEFMFFSSSSPNPIFLPGTPGEMKHVKLPDATCLNSDGSNSDGCVLPFFQLKKLNSLMGHDRKTVLAGTFGVYELINAGPAQPAMKFYWGEESGPLQNCLIYARSPSSTPGIESSDGYEIELMKYDPRN